MSQSNPKNQAFWSKIAERPTDIQQQFWYGAEKLAQFTHDNSSDYLTYREYDTSKPDESMSFWQKFFFYQGQSSYNESVSNHNMAVAISENSSWIWGMLKGDFNKSPTMSQVIVSGLISMIPIADQVCDVRDLISNLIDLCQENGNTDNNYMALALTSIGIIPEIGSAIKTIVKATRVKGVTKVSLIKQMEYFEGIFKKFKINSPWGSAPETWLRSQPWKGIATKAFNALKNSINRLLLSINQFLKTTRGVFQQYLEKFKKGITAALNSIKKYIDALCESVQKKISELLPQPQLAMAGGKNTPTNRYDVNVQSGKTTQKTHRQNETPPDKKNSKDKDLKDSCILRPYKPDTCKPKTGHHVVPDRCFRLGKRTINRKPIANAITENEGLVICVSKGGKTSEHNRIHLYYDKREKILGLNGNPKHTTTLFEVESLGAASVSAVVKCNKAHLLTQLRTYHQSKNMGPDFLVRADPSGKAIINEGSVGKDYEPPSNTGKGSKKL